MKRRRQKRPPQYSKPTIKAIIPTIDDLLEMRARNLFVDAPAPTDRYMKAREYCRMFIQSQRPITSKTIERGIKLGFLDGKIIRPTGNYHRLRGRDAYYLICDSQENRDAIDRRHTWTRLHRIKVKAETKAEKPFRFERLIDAFLEPFEQEWVKIEDMLVEDEAGLLLYPHTLFPLGFLVDYQIIEPEDLRPLREALKVRLVKLLDEKKIDDVHIAHTAFLDGQIVNLQPILQLGKHVMRIDHSTRSNTYTLRWSYFSKEPTPFTYQINLGEFRPK